MSDAVKEKLITARVKMLLNHPFFGNLATRMRLIESSDWCPTAATNGRDFFYNTEFVEKLSIKELEFLIGHELLHAIYDHISRIDGRDPRLSNIAQDYCVNADLLKHGVGEGPKDVPYLYNIKYEGWSYEEVYNDLYENAEKIDIDQLMEQLLDEHLEDSEDNNSNGSGNESNDENGEPKKGPPKLSKEEKQQIKDELKNAVLQAAQTAGAGNVPGGVKRILQELTEPKMDWRELLDMGIESTIKSDFTFQRPGRKSWHMDAIMPGMIPEDTIDICVAVDSSGSVNENMVRDMFSEIRGIMGSYTEFKLHLWCFDTEVHNPKVFTAENLDDIMEYDIQGYGGTEFMCNWEFMKANDIEPALLVVFTDGYPWGEWGDENYCDTLFIIHGNTNIEPPFGNHAYYDEAA